MINKDKFIIMADATDKSDLDSLKTFKQSGMDTFVLYPNDLDHYGAIERCEKAGLDVFIFGGSSVCERNKHLFPYAIDLFPNYMERYVREKVDLNKYNHLTGLYIIDEPSANFFDMINKINVPWFNSLYAGKKLWHINLLPSYATDEQLGVTAKDGQTAYEVYVNRYADEILPLVQGVKTIGVDNYPLRDKDGVVSLREDWLSDLAVVGLAAKRSKVIYSVCIQAYCAQDQKKVDCTGDIRFQLYTAMAFGASMFEFYAYSTAHGSMAMLDEDGNATDIYYSVRDAVREIRAFEKEYLKYDWVGFNTYLPQGGKSVDFDRIEKYAQPIDGVSGVKVSRETIISRYVSGKKSAYLVLNHGLPVISKSNIVDICFIGAERICIYQNGRKDYLETDNGKVTLFLEAGQGVFVIPE